MRKITQQATNAFKNCQFFSQSNTLVSFEHGVWGMELHGNHIASYNKEDWKLLLMDAGWQTNVTKERLNGILMAFGLPTIYQKNWQWYIGEEKRTGEKIFNV